MIFSIIFILIVCFGEIFNVTHIRYKHVMTEYGKIRGQITKNGDYVAFLGIPYAAPPINEYRFQAPKPPLPWKGVFDANKIVQCPQSGEGEEDCLILNIFTPAKPFMKLLPVLVHIHGGSFRTGSGQTRGVELLVKQDIIVVTMNYRLSALGFLCLGIKAAPGNAGLKDQVAALKWIQHNIAYFGGDPKQVTVSGVDAGSSSVEYLMLSNTAKGLFKNAIMESGSATAVYASDAYPITTALNMAKYLNFSNIGNLKALAEEYKRVPAKKLSLLAETYSKYLTDGTTGFAPCVEKRLKGIIPFIEASPHQILASGKYNQKPLLVIFASLEGLFLRSEEYYSQNYKERLESDFEDFLPADLIFHDEVSKKQMAMKINKFYFNNRPVEDNTIIEYLDFFGDTLIMHSLLNSVVLHAKHKNLVYLMEFVYRGGMGSNDTFYESLNMAGHGDPMKHVILEHPITNGILDNITVERMTLLFGNFVKYTNPTPVPTSLNPVIWQPVGPALNSTLFLNYDYHVLNKTKHLMRKWFWDDVYANNRRPVKPVDPKSYYYTSDADTTADKKYVFLVDFA